MDSISIILVNPQGDANIGACARAMKNFAITDLRLVNPVSYKTDDAYSWAVDAKDIVDKATVFKNLERALSDRSHSFAFTRRLGRMRRRDMSLDAAAGQISKTLKDGKVALVFGCEEAGLSNDEIEMCDQIVSIPTSSKLPSLNLAQAVILACYEVAMAQQLENEDPLKGKISDNTDWNYASRNELLPVISLLKETLSELGYENLPDNMKKDKIVNQFNKLFGRAGVTTRDIKMFEGLLNRIRDLIKSSNALE